MNHDRDCPTHWTDDNECDCSVERERLANIRLDLLEAVVRAARIADALCSIGPDGCTVDVNAMMNLNAALVALDTPVK